MCSGSAPGGGELDREALATLEAPCLEHTAPSRRPHASPEAVDPATTASLGLMGALQTFHPQGLVGQKEYRNVPQDCQGNGAEANAPIAPPTGGALPPACSFARESSLTRSARAPRHLARCGVVRRSQSAFVALSNAMDALVQFSAAGATLADFIHRCGYCVDEFVTFLFAISEGFSTAPPFLRQYRIHSYMHTRYGCLFRLRRTHKCEIPWATSGTTH
jgi:hypothetical protein